MRTLNRLVPSIRRLFINQQTSMPSNPDSYFVRLHLSPRVEIPTYFQSQKVIRPAVREIIIRDYPPPPLALYPPKICYNWLVGPVPKYKIHKNIPRGQQRKQLLRLFSRTRKLFRSSGFTLFAFCPLQAATRRFCRYESDGECVNEQPF